MDRDRLLLGLAAVFVGLAVALSAVALAEQPFLLLLALPFGVTAYFMWYQATGRLERRTRARARRSGPGGGGAGSAGRARRERTRRGPNDPWAGARTGGRTDGSGAAVDSGPTPAEAYRILGLDPDAGPDEVRAAYRERVKEVHPDADAGDEEAFKRVNRAYERLTD